MCFFSVKWLSEFVRRVFELSGLVHYVRGLSEIFRSVHRFPEIFRFFPSGLSKSVRAVLDLFECLYSVQGL